MGMIHERDVDVLAEQLTRIADELKAIRVLLAELRDDAGRCAHGVTGICMSCVIQNDLMRPHR